jgi:hypothetical protein
MDTFRIHKGVGKYSLVNQHAIIKIEQTKHKFICLLEELAHLSDAQGRDPMPRP